MHPFEPRPIEFLGLRRHAGRTLKECSIAWAGPAGDGGAARCVQRVPSMS